MADIFRALQYRSYLNAREFFVNSPERLIELENYLTGHLIRLIRDNLKEIRQDYDEASNLFPFWQHYPPRERGRKPRGDQFPWIEVGEHVVGRKLSRWLPTEFDVRDYGLPTGPDERLALRSTQVQEILEVTNACWLFVEIKSVGPRDDFDHAVLSHNQVSGDGNWIHLDEGVRNSVIIASGKRRKHEFYCAIPPIYVLSDGTVLPVVTVVIKLVYRMMSLQGEVSKGQPLDRISVITIPNGILLTENPGYLKQYPELFYPGKDDKQKNPETVRARVSFELIRKIASWRFTEIALD